MARMRVGEGGRGEPEGGKEKEKKKRRKEVKGWEGRRLARVGKEIEGFQSPSSTPTRYDTHKKGKERKGSLEKWRCKSLGQLEVFFKKDFKRKEVKGTCDRARYSGKRFLDPSHLRSRREKARRRRPRQLKHEQSQATLARPLNTSTHTPPFSFLCPHQGCPPPDTKPSLLRRARMRRASLRRGAPRTRTVE